MANGSFTMPAAGDSVGLPAAVPTTTATSEAGTDFVAKPLTPRPHSSTFIILARWKTWGQDMKNLNAARNAASMLEGRSTSGR